MEALLQDDLSGQKLIEMLNILVESPTFEIDLSVFFFQHRLAGTCLILLAETCISLLESDENRGISWCIVLEICLVKGFKTLNPNPENLSMEECNHQVETYTKWLELIKKSVIPKYKLISRFQQKPPKISIFSIIGAFTMIFYIERFITNQNRNAQVDQAVAPLENEITQLVASCHPECILFPLAFIAAHVMDFAYGPSTEGKARSMDELSSFLGSFFAIKHLPKRTDNMVISADTIKSWRIILKNDDEYQSPSKFARNTLFVFGIFTENCRVEINKAFMKMADNDAKSHFIDHHMEQFVLSAKLSPDDGPDYAFLLVKYLLMLDSFCIHSRPMCCDSKIENCCYIMGLNNSFIKSRVFDYILLAMIEIKSTFATERLYNCMETLRSFVKAHAQNQEEMYALMINVQQTTWTALVKDYEKYPDYEPILNITIDLLIASDIDSPFKTESAKVIGLTWHQVLVSIPSASVIGKVYISLLKRGDGCLIFRQRLLEAFEMQIEKSNQSVNETLSDLLASLSQSENPIYPGIELHDMRLAYFDILNIVHADKKRYFKINILIYVAELTKAPPPDDLDLEEGEELDLSIDDVVAAHLLFKPAISRLFPQYSHNFKGAEDEMRINCPPNILMTRELLLPPPEDDDVFNQQLEIYLAVWDSLVVSIPKYAFQKSLDRLYEEYILKSSTDSSMTCHVYAAFSMSYFWTMRDALDLIIQNISNDYTCQAAPYYGFVSYFKSLEYFQTLPKAKGAEMTFLWSLTEELANQLISADIQLPQNKNLLKATVKLDSHVYPFFTNEKFPKGLGSFLADCLGSSPAELLDVYFGKLFTEMWLNGPSKSNISPTTPTADAARDPSIFILIFVIVVVNQKQSVTLVDAAIKHMFLDSSSGFSTLSLNLTALPVISFLVPYFFSNAESYSRPVATKVMQIILSTRLNQGKRDLRSYCMFIRELILNRSCSIKGSDIFKTFWLDSVFEMAFSEPDSIGNVLAKDCLSFHNSQLIIRTNCIEPLIEILNSNASHATIPELMNLWKKDLHVVKKAMVIPLLSCFRPDLSEPIKELIESHFIFCRDNVATYLEDLMSHQLENSNSTFLDHFIAKFFTRGTVELDHFNHLVGRLISEYSAAFSLDEELPKSILKAYQTLLACCNRWLALDAQLFTEMLSQDGIVFSISTSIRGSLSVQDGKSLLSLLLKVYNLLLQQPEEEGRREIVLKTDALWPILLNHFLVYTRKSESLQPLFFHLLETLVVLIGTLSKSHLLTHLNEYVASKGFGYRKVLDGEFNDFWLPLLLKIPIQYLNVPLIVDNYKSLLVTSNSVALIRKWFESCPDSVSPIIVSYLVKNVENEHVLDLLAILSLKMDFYDRVWEIVSCLKTPILFEKVIAVLEALQKQIENDKAKVKWFQHRVSDSLNELSRMGSTVAFKAVIRNVERSLFIDQ